jgi:hypothetical protein
LALKSKSIVSISILIGILFLSITSIQTPVVLADPGISYVIQAQEKGGTWTPGLVEGYDECEDVPIRLIISYTGVTESPKDETSQTVSLEGAFKDSDSPVNYGLDYFKDFAYTDTGGLDGTPTVDGNPIPWAAGVGTGSEVDNNPIKNLQYVLFFELTAGSTGTLTITWKAHLAKGGENSIPADRGARSWIGPPSANLQVSADPPSGGEKTVNIKRPVAEGTIEVSKLVEGQFVTGTVWEITKSCSPLGLQLDLGETGTVTTTITVTKSTLSATYRMRGFITVLNGYTDRSVWVDILDQVQTTETALPGTVVDNAKWTWNDQEIAADSSQIFYFPGPGIADWFTVTDTLTADTDYFNLVWVGFNDDPSTKPTADPATANWGTDYENVKSFSYTFQFTTMTSGPDTVYLDEHLFFNGAIELVGEPTYIPALPWSTSDTATFQIIKTVRCTCTGIATINDDVTASDSDTDGNIVARFPTLGDHLCVIVEQPLGEIGELAPVGGIIAPSNKTIVLIPYIAFVGLVGIASSIFVLWRKRRA